jgi:CHAD domain-containing protein
MADAIRADRTTTVDDVIRSIILGVADRLIGTQSAAIQNAPDGVHQHRTSVRRLRSVLAGFRDHLDEPAAHDLRVQFAEWGHQLGTVRDFEVQADVAERAMADLGIEDADMRRRLVDVEREENARAHVRLCELFDGPRSVARMSALERFTVAPTSLSTADAAADVLEKVARREARRVRQAAKRNDETIESLHVVRKAGRRLRYVAEALHDADPEVFGAAFEELAAAGERVHDILGDHRDELIFIDRLQLSRAQAGRAGERVEHYDALIDRSKERAETTLGGLGDALAELRSAAAAV